MDLWRRLWEKKKWFAVVPAAPLLSGDRLWIVAVTFMLLGVALVFAVCWLACRDNTDEVETPILRWRSKSSKSSPSARKGEDDAA